MSEGGQELEFMLAKRIHNYRKAAGLTQQQLCQKANLSYSTLAKIERGAIKSPSVFTVQSIAEAIDISLDELVGHNTINQANRDLKTSRSGIKFVYFDVNGCLVRFSQRAFAKIADDFGVPSDMVETSFWHFNDQVCRGTMSMNEFNKQFAAKLGVSAINWQAYYLQAAEPVPAMAELLSWVHENYNLGLLTNNMPGFLAALKRNNQVPNIHYDAVVDSSEVGYIKPEKRIYEIALEKSGYQPHEILLIDDTLANLGPAEKLGWHVLWFDYARPEECAAHIKEALI